MLFPHDELKINDGYKLVKLKDLVKERKESVSAESEGNINYVGLENIESKTGRLVNYAPRPAVDIKSGSKKFQKGDILFGRLRPNLNKVLFNTDIDDGRCSTEILVLEPNSDVINPIYLSEIMRTEEINGRIVDLVKGAALPRVGITDLLNVEIPIPDVEKQNEISDIIVKKREELEEHIRLAQSIPMELDRMLVGAYS